MVVDCGCGPTPTVFITWERLVTKGAACPRCAETEDEINAAAAQLAASLLSLGVRVSVDKRALTREEVAAEPARSNRVWLNCQLVEEWLDGTAGLSRCCELCGPAGSRTIRVAGKNYEAVPAALIVQAGMLAAAQLLGPPRDGRACRCKK